MSNLSLLKAIFAAELSRSDKLGTKASQMKDKKLSIRAARQNKKAKGYILLA